GHHPPLLDHEDPVLLHPGLQGAVREGAVGQAEPEGVTGHGRPDGPVGLDEAVGERHHSLILPAPTARKGVLGEADAGGASGGPQVAGPQDGSAARPCPSCLTAPMLGRASGSQRWCGKVWLSAFLALFTDSNPWQEANQTWESLRS